LALSTELAIPVSSTVAVWEAKKDLIRSTVAEGANDLELELFFHQAKRTGLDPLCRQIHCIVRGFGDKRKATIQVGIDGLRLIADRTNCYAGNDDPVFGEEVESTDAWSVNYKDGGVKKYSETFRHPLTATVTVYKVVAGAARPFTATARWSEYYPKGSGGGMWRQRPFGQLGKCAEALALRKAFPADLSGLYTDDEMAQANVVDGPAAPVVTPESRNSGETRVNSGEKPKETIPAQPAPESKGRQAYGHSPARWPKADWFDKDRTETQGAILLKLIESRGIGVSNPVEFQQLLRRKFGVESPWQSQGCTALCIEWLTNAKADAVEAAKADLEAVTVEAVDVFEGPRGEFDVLCQAKKWPTWDQGEKSCRAVYTMVLGRQIALPDDLTESDWRQLIDWLRAIEGDPSAEPNEFKAHRLVEEMRP
jgi:phage recombination protein Bet